MQIFFKETLLGTVTITDTDFWWVIGKVNPTPAMIPLLKYIRWAELQNSFRPYHPYNGDWFGKKGVEEDPDHPNDDEARFRQSGNWELIQTLDQVLEWMRHAGVERVSRIDLLEVGGVIGEFADEMEGDDWVEEEILATDLVFYRDFLDYRHWKVLDKGKETHYLSYPPTFNIRNYSISWR